MFVPNIENAYSDLSSALVCVRKCEVVSVRVSTHRNCQIERGAWRHAPWQQAVAAFAPNDTYNFDKFIYNETSDTSTCPQQQTLATNGNWYQKSKQRYIYFVKHYKTNKCLTCPALAKCTLNKKGRLIERSEYQPYFEQNKKNIEANPLVYKKRQSIIEHNYGILKRQWGFYYINTKKGINRASADVGLMFCAYNLRRIINLVDKNLLKKFLKELWLSLLDKIVLLKGTVRSFFGAMIFYSIFFQSNNESKNKHLLAP